MDSCDINLLNAILQRGDTDEFCLCRKKSNILFDNLMLSGNVAHMLLLSSFDG